MQIKTLKEFVTAVEKKFGKKYPIGEIKDDYYGITFVAGRTSYRYDYETEEIFKIPIEISY